MACIRSLIIIRDTFPTTQTSNQKWNLSVTTIASSIQPVRDREQGIQCDGCHRWNHRKCNYSDIVSVFQSPPLNGKACRDKYRMLDRIESKIFLFLFFSDACRSYSKSPISPSTIAGARRDTSYNCLHVRIRRFLLLKSLLFLHFILPIRKRIFRKRQVRIR